MIKYSFFFDKKFISIKSPKILRFVSHSQMISIEAKQFFSSILVVFKIKLRKSSLLSVHHHQPILNFNFLVEIVPLIPKENISIKDMFNILNSCVHKSINEKFNFLRQELVSKNIFDNDDLSAQLALFKSQFVNRWGSSKRTEDRFMSKNSNWLEGSIQVLKKDTNANNKRQILSFLLIRYTCKARLC